MRAIPSPANTEGVSVDKNTLRDHFYHVIYFIAHAATSRVKIGYTRGPVAARFAGIVPCSPVPLELVGTLEGGPEVETALHREFADLRLHNEWFRLEGPLRALVRLLIVDGPSSVASAVAAMVNRSGAHGTISRYVRGCRCHACGLAWGGYQTARRTPAPKAAGGCPGCSGERLVLWRPGCKGRPPKCPACRERFATGAAL